MPKIPLAVQLYTLRDDAAKDFPATLRQVADIGYSAVELAGHHGMSPRDLKSVLDDCHLRVAGSHVGIDFLETNVQQAIDDALTLGNKYIVVPYLSEERRKDANGYRRAAESLTVIGETVQTFGLTLCYHNHDFELMPLANGELGLDILLQNTDPLFVKAEIDTYWVLKSGHDPVEYVRKYTGRVPLMHLKDRNTEDGSFAEVGTGDLPVAGLVEAAAEIGTDYLIVEQDVCRGPAIEAVTLSYNNLKDLGYA